MHEEGYLLDHRQPGSHVHVCTDTNVLSSAGQVETEENGKCLC